MIMKKFIVLICLFYSTVFMAQTPVAVKARLYKPVEKDVISIQHNNQPIEKLGQNVYKTFQLKANYILTLFSNDNLVETIAVSHKPIDMKSLKILLTESTVLKQIETEYTNLNSKLGLDSGQNETKAERCV